jgi:hypothetical protein
MGMGEITRPREKSQTSRAPARGAAPAETALCHVLVTGPPLTPLASTSRVSEHGGSSAALGQYALRPGPRRLGWPGRGGSGRVELDAVWPVLRCSSPRVGDSRPPFRSRSKGSPITHHVRCAQASARRR